MPAEPLALSTVPPPAPAETDYDAICAAVTATARGRWFLDEYAKRNRNSDTGEVLAAIARMEAAVLGERAQQASQEANRLVRIELLEMARTIAQARAEIAESRPAPSQQLPAEPATAVAPDVAGAAERLRQIAWTMRACGVEVAASDQIGQIAETILSADALRSLGDQRAHRLTEALHYLEHRIDQMLDGRLAAAAAADAGPEPEDGAPQPNADGRHAAVASVAVLAVVTAAPDGDAGGESPPPVAVDESAAAPAADASQRPFDDDVVLAMAGSIAESEPPPPAADVAADQEPMPAAASTPAPMDQIVEPEPEPLPPADFEAQDLRIERAQLELGPMAQPDADAGPTPALARDAIEPSLEASPESPASNDNNQAEAEFAELEPVLAPTPIGEVASEGVRTQPALVAEPAIEDRPHPASAGAASAQLEPIELALGSASPDFGANDDRPLTPATQTAATASAMTDLPEPELISGAEAMTAAELTVEPIAVPPPPASADAVAQQMDHDLDGLSDAAPGLRAPAPRSPEPPTHALAANEDDPADFLLVTLSGQTRPAETPQPVPAGPPVSQAQFSNALAAIETELFAAPESPVKPAAATPGPSPSPSAAKLPVLTGPLAAVMAMSEEERIALFS